ncbi:capsule biosynthesis GfcC family protein [Photobacterium galatheae]|uniref:capsule biosynthesis GfcC family protein n=1 Tax=Photobacterium galatheae TaxID=1654360 RepID=UPI00202CB032|nr:capsule biosynthesis GfcC family protein [Photobacterium galatheae]MCM0147585.1 capsule biosynthesis GfcC family protein [Photobacterium galatheae]
MHTLQPYRQISHKITTLLIVLLAWCTLSTPAFSKPNTRVTAPTEVELRLNQSHQALQLRYPTTVRLEQVLQDTLANLHQLPADHSGRPLYWFGSTLWRSDGITRKAMKRQQSAVIQQLQQLALHWQNSQPETSHSLQVLAKSLSTPLPGQRIFQPLDLDWVRIAPNKNPGLNGQFMLQVITRPETVKVFAALSQPNMTDGEITIPWQERNNATDYLQQVTPLTISHKDYLWVIQPDGNTEQHEIAYWNRNHKDIAPGATLYLPLTSLPDGYESLNHDIVNLLKQRPF